MQKLVANLPLYQL